MPIVNRLLAGWTAILLIAAPAGAQETATIEGIVRAEDDLEPLHGVSVYLEQTDLGALTDARGRFRIVGIAPGEYVLIAEYIGREAIRRVVNLERGEAVTINLELAADALDVGEIVVSVSGEATRKAETAATINVLAGEKVRDLKAAHPSDVMGRIPGVLVNTTAGQGHMMAMRQPITTSAVYLYLEDGVPTRSTGFFNHNALYEVNLPQAGQIEVVKGPATALYGSDAIGGVINVRTRAPTPEPDLEISLEGGSFGFARLLASGSTTRGRNGVRADLNVMRTDGWRAGTAYSRQTGTIRWDRDLDEGRRLKTVATFSRVNQNTAGSSQLLRDDYLNRPTLNYAPISYRNVRAFRLSTEFRDVSPHTLWSVTPYARWNEMELLPNWSLTYDPTAYSTGHKSLGVLIKYRRDFEPLRTRLITGVDVDYSPGSHFERTIVPRREGEVFTAFTAGSVIYDYDVTFRGISPYARAEVSPTEELRISVGLRYDYLGYDYENALGIETDGPHRRPASTEVAYGHISPKFGLTWRFGPNLNAYMSYGHGFRVPSQAQLFRQGRAENTVGLEPVKADNYEVGLRARIGDRLDIELAAYSMSKSDDILDLINPDGTRETVNAGETLHRGVELAVGARLTHSLHVGVSYSYVRHTYERWRARRGLNFSGNEMESAPRHIGNARLNWTPELLADGELSLEWSWISGYWLDARNTHRYDGHNLVNVRTDIPITDRMALFGRVMNVTDERYAETASFTQARGSEYAPGLPRRFYLGLQYK